MVQNSLVSVVKHIEEDLGSAAAKKVETSLRAQLSEVMEQAIEEDH